MRTPFTAGVCGLCLLVSQVAFADSLDAGRKIITKTNRTLAATQKTIDRLDEKTRAMLDEYNLLGNEIENYRIYNAQLQDIVNSQKEEMTVLEKDIDQLDATSEQIMPFMQRMIDGLETFVASDLPFLPEERQERLARLKANMKRADISVAAKFRQILEAYQVENDYGKTIEAYAGEQDGKQVTFLKVGRIGLYYLSLDRSVCAVWQPDADGFVILEDMAFNRSIMKAIRIAEKQSAPELFFAAVPPAEVRE